MKILSWFWILQTLLLLSSCGSVGHWSRDGLINVYWENKTSSGQWGQETGRLKDKYYWGGAGKNSGTKNLGLAKSNHARNLSTWEKTTGKHKNPQEKHCKNRSEDQPSHWSAEWKQVGLVCHPWQKHLQQIRIITTSQFVLFSYVKLSGVS